MTIEQLNSIIELKDVEQIDKSLVDLGYRNASKYAEMEFDLDALCEVPSALESECYEEDFGDLRYQGEFITGVPQYPNSDFVLLTVSKVYRNRNNLEMPLQVKIYTTAPINEEYEREMAKLCKCAICKRQFPMGELCEINGKLVCDDCFEKDLQRLKSKGKSKLATKIKK